MFIKRLHLFCSYQIGVGGNNASLANTGLTLLEQRNLLVPLQTLKKFVQNHSRTILDRFCCRTCIETYVRQPLYTLLQIGLVRCALDQRYNTLLFIWYTYIRPWRFTSQTISNDHRATNLLDTTAVDQESSTQDQSIMNAENISFVERNILFYGRLFQFAIDRLQKTDLTNSFVAQLINKLANVMFISSIKTYTFFSFRYFQLDLFLNYFSKARLCFVFCNFSSNSVFIGEQVAMYSLSSPNSSGKQRITPPSSASIDGPRPSYSILCDETQTLVLGCLRKISSALQKNQRHIDEGNRLVELERQRSQTAQMVSTNARDLLTRILLKIPYVQPQQLTAQTLQPKPVLPTEIIEQLINTKNKFNELFQVIFNLCRQEEEEDDCDDILMI